MDDPIPVRSATLADAAAIAALEEACLGDDAWSEVLVAQGLTGQSPAVHFLVAGDPVAAHAVVAVAGDITELQRIAVDPSHRRRGVAGALLAEAVRLGRAAAADRLLVEVREDNAAALGFYAAQGFVEIDRRPRYYADGATAVVMRRGLVAGCGGSM
ncbi:MAG: GNAT family N-acetyltransferase [Marmoricola sp.]